MQNGRIYFVLALHNHQPVGNLPEVFEHCFEKAYGPFIEVLERFPEMKIVLHYTGSLLDWICEHRPWFIDRLRGLVSRGQVEIMGGAYYEPILPSIPEEDQIGQIEYLSQRVEELFGVRPEGMWLAERVWEPHLARPVVDAGLHYATVDDTHFHDAGQLELDHYYRTEEEGRALDIFPINEDLRYLIPFKAARESIDYLRARRPENGKRLYVLADDGEKFGVWPDTHALVYEEGWLESFLELLQEERDWLQTITFSEFRALYSPSGPVYLPTGSYREMKEWSGGFWRNFLTRYPESNRMHKKMLAVRRHLDQIPRDSAAYAEARRLLWAGQCNCAYWHGVFGGLYLNFLRAGVWGNLLRAESIIDHARFEEPFLEVIEEDRLYEGRETITLRTDRLVLLLAPHLGGSMWELSWRPAAINLLDTLTRRPEDYHQELLEQGDVPSPPEAGAVSIHHRKKVKEEGLHDYLIYDSYPRVGLVEHFLDPGTTLEEFRRDEYGEAPEFLLQPAETSLEPFEPGRDKPGKGLKAIFRRTGKLKGDREITLTKILLVQAGADRLVVEYELDYEGSEQMALFFAVEWNFAFSGGYDRECFYAIPGRRLEEAHLASTGSEVEVDRILLVDRLRGISLTLSWEPSVLLWRMPVETVSLSESGLERSYQQSLLLGGWNLELKPGEKQRLRLEMDLAFPEETGGGEEVRETEGELSVGARPAGQIEVLR